jgi:TldD protein
MTDERAPTDPFFKNSDLTPLKAAEIVREGLKGADYGEFYQEIVEKELLVKDKGQYSTIAPSDSKSGFGFRVGQEERVGYSFSDVFNEVALRGAVKQARQVLAEEAVPAAEAPAMPAASAPAVPAPAAYPPGAINPLEGLTLAEKIAKIDEIEAYVKSLDPRVANVTVQYRATAKAVHVITADGASHVDHRPNVTLSIGVTLTDAEGKSETGHALRGGAVDCTQVFDPAVWQAAAQKALKQADTLLIAEEAPAGVMDVVLNHGWPAVILHEAIGHGLEGDFNRRGISVYSGKIGQKIACDEVTVVDRGDLPGERGTLSFDDEGTPTQENVLIEKGVLKGYMQDRQNALLMGVDPTGNGRRESYTDTPMPRMTNTYFRNGPHDPADIIKSVKDGLYIEDMGGGQVDITSGKFNMNATLGYRIRDGKLCEPVKGATLVGDGLTVIQSITMVGNDLEIEKSAGMCGKNGQSVVVSCGQPTVRVSNMTVGGAKRAAPKKPTIPGASGPGTPS